MANESLVGEIPSGWTYTTLGEICRQGGGSIQTGPFGSQLHASDYVEFGVPSIMPVNIGDNRLIKDGIAQIREADAQRLSKHRVQEGDIVYSRRGDVEKRALVRSKERGWLCGTGCLKVRIGCHTNPVYASYYLGHPSVREWITRHAVGATMPNLNTAIMEAVPFVLPSRVEQDCIAHILGSLDDKIEVNRRMNETLEAMARALFKSWFIDFDPVRAKADGRKPEGMDEATAKLFPDSFEQSELGAIPKGWRVDTLGELIELAYGKALRERDRRGGDVPVYGSNGRIGWHDKKFVGGPGVIVGRKGNPGIVKWSETDFYPIDTSFYVKLLSNSQSLHFFYYALQYQDLPSLGADSAVPGLNRNLAYMSLQIVPPPSIVRSFDIQATSLFASLNRNSEESHTLAATRDALLPKLLSGELRVKDAERFAEAAL